jgi:hypothetical protein
MCVRDAPRAKHHHTMMLKKAAKVAGQKIYKHNPNPVLSRTSTPNTSKARHHFIITRARASSAARANAAACDAQARPQILQHFTHLFVTHAVAVGSIAAVGADAEQLAAVTLHASALGSCMRIQNACVRLRRRANNTSQPWAPSKSPAATSTNARPHLPFQI